MIEYFERKKMLRNDFLVAPWRKYAKKRKTLILYA